jgi:hypothetical protein
MNIYDEFIQHQIKEKQLKSIEMNLLNALNTNNENIIQTIVQWLLFLFEIITKNR